MQLIIELAKTHHVKPNVAGFVDGDGLEHQIHVPLWKYEEVQEHMKIKNWAKRF